MDACMNRDVHNKSRVYSGTETSEQPSTRRGYSKGEETYQAHVESPASWGYAITIESEKAKYQHIKDKYQQIKAKYEQINSKYEQSYAKYEQTCECNTSVNDQHAKNKIEFTDQGPLLKIPTDNPASTHALHADEMKKCRMSRARLVSTCRLHSRKKREREPSRIPYRKQQQQFIYLPYTMAIHTFFVRQVW